MPKDKGTGKKTGTIDLKSESLKGATTLYLLLKREEVDIQTTCDEPNPNPHPAPNESTGTYRIIKNYVTDDNGKYTDDGCYAKTQVASNIQIEDETKSTGYTLIGWKATDSETTHITSVRFIFLHFFLGVQTLCNWQIAKNIKGLSYDWLGVTNDRSMCNR